MVEKQEFIVDTNPVKKLGRNFDQLRASLQDMRPLFETFASDFYKDEKRIFALKGPGKYTELTDEYEIRKFMAHGFIYPILFATGRLANSLLSRGSSESVLVIKKQEFRIGTTTPYAVYHHSKESRTIIPRRPVYFFGKDNPQQTARWHRLVKVYIDKQIKGAFG